MCAPPPSHLRVRSLLPKWRSEVIYRGDGLRQSFRLSWFHLCFVLELGFCKRLSSETKPLWLGILGQQINVNTRRLGLPACRHRVEAQLTYHRGESMAVSRFQRI